MAQSSSSSSSQPEDARADSKREIKRILNVRLLIGTLVAVVILTPVAFFWHSYQVGRTASAFLSRAESLEKEKNWGEASQYIFRYLRLRPDDVDARIRLAETFDKGSRDPWATSEYYYRALGMAPADRQPALRRRLAELLMAAQTYGSARAEAEKLLAADDQDPLGRRLLALALLGQYQTGTLLNESDKSPPVAQAFEDALVFEVKKLAQEVNKPGQEVSTLAETVTYLDQAIGQLPNEDIKLSSIKENLPTIKDDLSTIEDLIDSISESEELSAIRDRSSELSAVTQLSANLASIYRAKKDEELLLNEQQRAETDTVRKSRADQKMDDMVEIVVQAQKKAGKMVARLPDALEATLDNLEAKLDDLKAKLDDAEADLDDLTAVLDRLMIGRDALEADLDDLTACPAVAYLARYQYRISHEGSSTGDSELEKALKDDLAKALELSPNHLTVRLVAGEHAQREAIRARRAQATEEADKFFDEAVAHYGYIIDTIAPANGQTYLLLGNIHETRGDLDDAIKTYRLGLERTNNESPDLYRLYLNIELASILIKQPEPDETKRKANLTESNDQLAAFDRLLAELEPQWRQLWSRRQQSPALILELKNTRDLVRANWLLQEGEVLPALPLLKRVATGPASTTDIRIRFKAWHLLGRVFFASQQWDRAAAAFEQAGLLDPTSLPEWRLAADAWRNAGRVEGVVRCLKRILEQRDSAEIWLALARAQFQSQAYLPKQQRRWEPFIAAFNRAKDPNCPEPLRDNVWRLNLLKADYRFARGETTGQESQTAKDEALKLLRDAENDFAESKDLFRRLVLIYEQLGATTDADRTLAEFDRLVEKDKHTDESVVAYVLRAQLCMKRKLYEQARQELHSGLENKDLSAVAQLALHRELINLDLQQAETKATFMTMARDGLAKLHAKRPQNVKLLRQLATLAQDAGDFSEAEVWENKLAELEGPDATHWRLFRAQRLLATAKDRSDQRLDEAEELLAQIQTRRPEWSRAFALKGTLLARRGQAEMAIEAYQNAIRLGERRVIIYERLIGLLLGAGRFAEADQELAHLRDYLPFTQTLSLLDMAVAEQLGQLDRAVDVARSEVERRPEDAAAHMRLGHLLDANRQAVEATTDAEAAFRTAVQLAPTDVRTHNALFAHYLRAGRPDRARETLDELEKALLKLEDKAKSDETLSQSELDEELSRSRLARAYVMGQGYERLGDREEALKYFKEAEDLAPDNVAIKLRLAGLLIQSSVKEDTENAEKILRDVPQSAPEYGNARRALVQILVARGGRKEWQEARQLLERSPSVEMSAPDQRLLIQILRQRKGRDNLQKARRLLEELVAESKTISDADHLLFAHLYETEGRLQTARQHYVSVVSRPEPNKQYVAQYINFLLRHNDLHQASRQLDSLERLTPDDLRTLGLRARWADQIERLAADDSDLLKSWLQKQSEPDIESVVEKRANDALQRVGEDPKKEAQLARDIGSIYVQIKQHQAAERWFRRLFELTPEEFQPLAVVLAKQGRTKEAITLCKNADDSDNPLKSVAILASVLVSAAEPAEEDFELAEPLLEQCLEDGRSNVGLLEAVAGIRIVQQKTDKAIELYLEMLQLNSRHPRALNNLATLLSEIPGRENEALLHINQAIEIQGEQPALLDTKGMVLVHSGKADEAVDLLKQATFVPNADPRFSFHLAVAYQRTGQTDEARDALQLARDRDLEGTILTAMDRKLLEELAEELR